jgi:hypothetical protein
VLNKLGHYLKLHENKDEFAQAIQAASNNLGIREVFIEKDYWVCFVLKNLSLTDEFKSQVVFKGGTSLSKAHKAIFMSALTLKISLPHLARLFVFKTNS